ncbi:MAG: hypothetical protein AABZ74_08020 [Cyanobacteriota bacterium]
MSKKLKFLSFIFLITIFSCTLPTEIIEPKINGVKISKEFKNITDMVVTDNEDIYIVDNNVIKKIDSKGEITIIAGNEKEEINTENIDGDIKTAKFGKINKIQYVEKEKTVYFEDYFLNQNKTLIRRININKTVETILKEDYIYYNYLGITKDGYIYKLNSNSCKEGHDCDFIIQKLNTELKEIKSESLNIVSGIIFKIIETSESDFYFLKSYSFTNLSRAMFNRKTFYTELILKLDSNKILRNKIVKLSGIYEKDDFENILLDSKDNLYIKLNLKENLNNIIYKISKDDIDKQIILPDTESFSLEKKNIVGYIPKNLYINSIDEKKKMVYAFNKNVIYKIKIGENK